MVLINHTRVRFSFTCPVLPYFLTWPIRQHMSRVAYVSIMVNDVFILEIETQLFVLYLAPHSKRSDHFPYPLVLVQRDLSSCFLHYAFLFLVVPIPFRHPNESDLIRSIHHSFFSIYFLFFFWHRSHSARDI
jgi:hypothetical protein